MRCLPLHLVEVIEDVRVSCTAACFYSVAYSPFTSTLTVTNNGILLVFRSKACIRRDTHRSYASYFEFRVFRAIN